MTAENRLTNPQAHLTAFLTGVGYHESAWRLADPADLSGPARFGVLERAAQTAERGLLDAVFFADSPGLAIFRAPLLSPGRLRPAGDPRGAVADDVAHRADRDREEFVEVVSRLWQSWDADAVVNDQAHRRGGAAYRRDGEDLPAARWGAHGIAWRPGVHRDT
jgi:hypothetical protein